MKIENIFTEQELALIDSGKYKPGRAVLDAKLDLVAAIEREVCAKVCDSFYESWINIHGRYEFMGEGAQECAAAIRTRGQA